MPAAASSRLAGALALAGASCAYAWASSFPEMAISRATSPYEWPFSVEEGTLTCVEMSGSRTVIFAEPWRADVAQEFGDMTLPRSVIVSANPLALLASLEDRDLFSPFDSLETLIKRLAPFERMGWALCAANPANEK